MTAVGFASSGKTLPRPDKATAEAAVVSATSAVPTSSTSATSSTTAMSSTTTVSTTTTVVISPGPSALVNAVNTRLQDPRFAGSTVAMSVWMEGFGEVVAYNADQQLRPGSNEKLLVAAGALSVIGPDSTLATEVRTAGQQDGPVLRGDLVLVGGGDPSLRTWGGGNSLEALANQLRARGITEVTGDLVGDESRYDDRRTAPGWTAIHMPTFVGPLSALAVDGNQVRADPDYLANPAAGNAAAFRQVLERVGIRVAGGERSGKATPSSETIARVESPSIGSLVADMLTRSDNFLAELLAKEVGRRATGRGTTADGLAAAANRMEVAGLRLTGRAADGSGLSRDNTRPAREWQQLLRTAAAQPWGPVLFEGLPVAGRTGTLLSRFRGTPAEGTVRAKTGSVREARALSGYLTTAGGRRVVFSLIVNGPGASSTLAAMDELVTTVVANRD